MVRALTVRSRQLLLSLVLVLVLVPESESHVSELSTTNKIGYGSNKNMTSAGGQASNGGRLGERGSKGENEGRDGGV